MMNVRSRARFAQKTRSRPGILGGAPVDDLESSSRVQHCIASAVSDGHRSRTELDRKTISTYLHFEVRVSQWSGRQPTSRRWSLRVFAVREEPEGNETTQALTIWTAWSPRSSSCRASARCFRFRFHNSEPMLFASTRKSQLTPSVSDRDGVTPDRHLQDQKQCCPLPFSTIRGNAGGDAKARCAEWQLALQVEP